MTILHNEKDMVCFWRNEHTAKKGLTQQTHDVYTTSPQR